MPNTGKKTLKTFLNVFIHLIVKKINKSCEASECVLTAHLNNLSFKWLLVSYYGKVSMYDKDDPICVDPHGPFVRIGFSDLWVSPY